MSLPYGPIYKSRDLGPKGLNLGCNRTIRRFVAEGRLPPPDLRMPNGEDAWFQENIHRVLDGWASVRTPK